MENYVSLFVATLQHLGHLTEAEAKALSEKLHNTTIPGTYKEASRVIGKIIADVKTPPKTVKIAPKTK